ncbi:hypothetical protein Trydic_g23478 [Trypoxylus dichotomus]
MVTKGYNGQQSAAEPFGASKNTRGEGAKNKTVEMRKQNDPTNHSSVKITSVINNNAGMAGTLIVEVEVGGGVGKVGNVGGQRRERPRSG